MIEITHEEIDTAALLRAVESNLAGAVVLFLGTTREMTGDRCTTSLVYEAYETMARQKMADLADEAASRWPLTGCAIVHRLGQLAVREASVGIAVSSPHRQDAFEAGKWLIDTLKEVVPIWKQENWADGTCQWVHPGEPPAADRPKRSVPHTDRPSTGHTNTDHPATSRPATLESPADPPSNAASTPNES